MEIDLKDLLVMLWHRAWIIILATLVGGGIAFSITFYFITPMYTASASMYVSNDNRKDTAITASDLSVSQSLVDTYIVILKSETLLSKVVNELPYDYSIEDIDEMLSAGSIDGTEAFSINITNSDPKVAQTITNTIARIAPNEIIRVVKAGAVEVIDYASTPQKPYWPLMINAVIGALLALMVSSFGVVLFNMMDITIHSTEDLVDRYNLPVLGVIPSVQISNNLKDSVREEKL